MWGTPSTELALSFDDELAMIRLCEAVFPCERTRSMRVAIEFERDL